MRKLTAYVLTTLFLSASAFAEEPQPRLISVTGEGEVFAVPDEVWVNFQMESFHEKLSEAKKANDDAIKQALDIVKKYQVEDKDFRTDHFTVRNDERYFMDPQTNQQRSKRGFFVTKNVAVVLRDISKFEAMYSDVLEAGINNINGVEFKTSEVKKYRDEARALAVRAAKEKAQQLASELGQEISRPYTVQENVQTEWGGPRPMMMELGAAGKSSENNETIALGQIKITTSVAVSFEMK